MPLTLFTFQFILRALQIIIDFVILWIVIYYVLRIVRNNSRTVQIFKGIILVIALWYVASVMKLLTTKALLDYVIQYAFLVVIIIFQPEIRGMLERLGQTSVFSALHSLSGNEKEQLVDELVEATVDLSKRRVGALISIEQGHSLSDYVKTGTPINSSVTSELLSSIFVTSTPLHDGAVIIQGDRIACASAYFPPTNIDLPTSYGARHRAAIGLSEVTDSITIIVSEETGRISVAEAGRLREMDEVSLRDYLNLLIQNSEKEVSQSLSSRRQRRLNLSRLNLDPIKVEKAEGLEIPARKPAADEAEEKPDFSKLMGIFRKKPKKDNKKPKVTEDKPVVEEKPAEVEEPIVFVEDETPVVKDSIELLKEKALAETVKKAEEKPVVKKEVKAEVEPEVKTVVKKEVKSKDLVKSEPEVKSKDIEEPAPKKPATKAKPAAKTKAAEETKEAEPKPKAKPKSRINVKAKDTDEVTPSKPKATKVKEVKKSEIGGDLDETEEK